MSSTEVRASIIISARDEASKTLTKVGQSGTGALKDLNKGAADVIQKFTGLNVASLGAAAGIGLLAGGLAYAVKQAAEAEKIMAVTEAVVKSTGMAAGLTAEQIAGLSGKLSQLNAVDDELIQSSANVLLTFKKIGKESFEPAMQAALDLSVVLGQDLRSSTMQLGKALEDPVRGITALRRAGVSFTVEQQKLIKSLVETGRHAEAMELILAEVNTQVGGAGVAAAKTYSGQLALLRINVDNLAQSLGDKLLPPLTTSTAALNLSITWNQKITEAYSAHSKSLVETTDSYAEYKAGVMASANATDFQLGRVELLTEEEYQLARVQTLVTDGTVDYGIRLRQATDAQQEHNIVVSSTGEYYADMVADIDAAAKAQKRFNENLLAAVDAGLDGTIRDAVADYRDVIAETQPEIDKLNGDIARMNAAHGQTFTVVTEAKHSIAEYELAQIRAAIAAQKLAEYTGDNREELLTLTVAAENAAGRVAQMGTEMGITEQFTADYTKALQDANGDLGELESKQAAALEALRKTTGEFIFQKIAMEMDGEAAALMARKLGLLSEQDYQLTLRVIESTHAWDLDKDGMIEAGAEAEGLAGDLKSLKDSTVNSAEAAATGQTALEKYGTNLNQYTTPAIIAAKDASIDLASGINSIPAEKTVNIRMTTTYQDVYLAAFREATGGGRAHGGPVAGGQSYLVGERGPEIFTPTTSGNITPNDELGTAAGATVTFAAGSIVVNAGPGMDEEKLAEIASRKIAAALRRVNANGAYALGQ